VTRWYTRRGDAEQRGPFDLDVLQRGLASGEIPRDAMFCREGEHAWLTVGEVAELAGVGGETSSPQGSLGVNVEDELVGFRLTARLGEGGMAIVFRGENVLDRTIVRAIKIVRPELASRREFRARVAEEARILERLSHKNIVRFYGVRQDRGLLVLELELLDGESLAAALARGHRFGLRDAVEVTLQAAEGVAAAHAMGVVHRDLKPDNLFRGRDGVVKVLDFGIARALDEADRATRATTAGTTPGTAAYLAPEVWSGGVPSATADVYALGVSLLELLSGHHPFLPPGMPSKSSPQLMFMHIQGELPSVRTVNPKAPALLDHLIRQATAKDPGGRYPNAGALADALRGVLTQLPVGEVQVTPGAASLTDFALPQFHAQPTTGRAVVGEPSGPPRRRLGMLAIPLVIVGAAAAFFALGPQLHGGGASAASVSAAPSTGPSASTAPAAPAAKALNAWVRVESSNNPVRLGVDDERSPDPGFRPSRGIVAPSVRFEMQQHEVTWRELDPWISAHAEMKWATPAGLPQGEDARANLPAVGVPWATALAYCKSVGGTLPTEEQWEYAARGAERRPHPWGSEPVDTARTHAFAGREASVAAVMTSDQDQTGGEGPEAIADLAGNALEWTVDLYRDDRPNQDEGWVDDNGVTYRALRGLPLTEPRPKQMPHSSAAYRQALCVGAKCPADTTKTMATVGFRCVRRGGGQPQGGPELAPSTKGGG